MLNYFNDNNFAMTNNLQLIDPDSNHINVINEQLASNNGTFYSIEKFNIRFPNKNDQNLLILSYNIRSFNTNGDNFITFLDSLVFSPDIIVLCETWLTNDSKEFCNINGYISYHNVRNHRGGGVSVFYKRNLQVDHLSVFFNNNSTVESIAIKVLINEMELYVVGIYRPFTDSVENFVAFLNTILCNPLLKHKNLVLCGDFNINLTRHDSNETQMFVNNMQTHYFLPVITEPTRFSSTQLTEPSLLDHIWINIPTRYSGGVISYDVTDHCPTFLNLNTPITKNPKHKITFREFNVENMQKFVNLLNDENWSQLNINDVNEQMEIFTKTLNKYYCSSFPIKIKYISDKRLKSPWLTSGLLKSIKTKSNYFKLLKRGLISPQYNAAYRNRLTTVIRVSKKNYYDNLFKSNCKNTKETWRVINGIISNNKKRPIESIRVADATINEKDKIVNHFNSFFANIANDLDRRIPVRSGSFLSHMKTYHLRSMFLHPISHEECINIINATKNTINKESIPTKILKKIKHIIVKPLCFIINNSISNGIFPQCLKKSFVTPVYKGGDHLNVESYRPISVLPLFSKILEKYMAIKLSQYLEKMSILSTKQFGFQKGMGTVDAILTLMEDIYESINREQYMISLFVDLRKAFDTVNHEILLSKLHHYGIRGIVHDWFKSYLSNRKQCVQIMNHTSEEVTMNIGVPQGSILGPILFLLYINDLSNVSDLLSTVLFADDTTLYRSDSNYNNLIAETNNELNKINQWLINNRLSINLSKTFVVIFSNKRFDYLANPLRMNNEVVTLNELGKFLGVFIDRKLTFNEHVNAICSKLSKTIGIFYKINSYIPEKNLINLYYSFFYPFILYCNIVWGGCTQNHLNKILLLQKRIVRIITKENYLAHTDPLFKRTGILKITDLHTYLCAIEAFKTFKSQGFNYLDHPYDTRHRNKPVPTMQRLTTAKKSLSHSLPQTWNSLPDTIKEAKSLNVFKKLCREYLLSKYTS